MNLEKKIIIFTIIAISIYSIFLVFTDINLVYDQLSNFKFEYVPIILVLIFLSWIILFIRWILLLKNSGVIIPTKDNFLIFFTGYAFAISPGKSGELIKSIMLKEKFNVKRSTTVPVILAERFYDVVGALIIALCGVFFLDTNFLPIIVGAGSMLGLIFIIIYSKSVFNLFLSILSKIRFLSKFIESITNSQEILKKSVKSKIAITSISLTVLYRLIESFGVLVILLAFNIDILHYISIAAIYATSIILGNVSLIPGGVGVTEGSLTGLFSLQGIDISIAVVLAIVIRFFTLWFAVIVGFVAMKISKAIKFID